MTAVASEGRPSDRSTQQAANLAATGTGASAPGPEVPPTAPPPVSGPIPVFVQYANPEQLCQVGRLEAALRTAGYGTPPAEQVGAVPNATSVRYFWADPTALQTAKSVAGVANGVGFKASPQDATKLTTAPLRQIEIWLARADNAPTTDALLGADCKPFAIGDPIG